MDHEYEQHTDRRDDRPQDASHAPPPPPPPPPPYYEQREVTVKSTAFAVILSAICPGLGFVYLGYYKEAFITVILFAAVVTGLSSGAASGLEPLFGIFLGFFYFYQLVDAGRRATLINKAARARAHGSDLDELPLPSPGGDRMAGVALIVVGAIALLHTKLGVSMRWLEDWWPLLLIGLGAYLFHKSRRDREETERD